MLSHRTIARATSVTVLALALSAGSALAVPGEPETPTRATATPAKKKTTPVSRGIFPVVGPVQYINDFGAPRAQGAHEGIDIMAPRKAIAVAAEAGTVKFYAGSSRAGCMLYLYATGGTTYLYIHLNNDLGTTNDNKGKCVPGTAFAPGLKSGAKVQAGQPIGFVGDSGDANGVAPHLHFERHPHDGAAANPFSFLNTASRLLFAVQPGSTFTLTLNGSIAATSEGKLQLKIDSLRISPGGTVIAKVGRTLSITIPLYAVVQRVANGIAAALGLGTLSSAKKGQPVAVFTEPATATLDTQLGKAGTLSAARVVLKPKK